jgi:hypothetical protein
MMSKPVGLRVHYSPRGELGLDGHAGAWPADQVLLASVRNGHLTHCFLGLPDAALEGEALTSFLDRVAPFGSPPPPSLIRAYSLPDAPFPSILLKEHEEAPEGIGQAYQRFLDNARQRWLAALRAAGPGLCPALAWRCAPQRSFLEPVDWVGALADAGVRFRGVADGYLGRGLLLLADRDLARSWRSMMSLGGVTKARKMTGREFPVWVDLPAHQEDLLASPLLARVEEILTGA